MEFAVRPVVAEGVDDEGRPLSQLTYEFYLLQVRPQTTNAVDETIQMTRLEPHQVLLAHSNHAFGHLQRCLSRAVVLSNDIVGTLGQQRTQSMLRELDRLYRNDYLLIGPDAEEFLSGSSGFESLYSGLSPEAVISLKTLMGIRSLSGYSGSHAADNIERAPVIIQESSALEPGLQTILDHALRRIQTAGHRPEARDLLLTGDLRVELDGNSGQGQVFLITQGCD
jgi:hypothetical protein